MAVAWKKLAREEDVILKATPQLGGNLDPQFYLIGPTVYKDLGNLGATPTIAFGTTPDKGYKLQGTVNTSWTSPVVLPDPGICQVYSLIMVKSDDTTERLLLWPTSNFTWLNNNPLSTMGTTAKARFKVHLERIASGVWLASYSTAGQG